MAGFYTDVPAPRMAYDIDGTQCYQIGLGASLSTVAAYGNMDPIDRGSYMARWNNEDLADIVVTPTTNGAYVLIFPELRDLQASHFMFQYFNAAYLTAETSEDTTNGMDGVWATYGLYGVALAGKPALRIIGSDAALGIRAIRFRTYAGSGFEMLRNIAKVHLYGTIASGENLQRLELWHPTLDQSLGAAAFDWGDVARDTTETRTFRVKNLHATLTANTPRVATSILTDTSPSIPAQIRYSLDEVSWLAQLELANLAPGAISALVYQRRITPDNATLGLWWYRVFADALTWS